MRLTDADIEHLDDSAHEDDPYPDEPAAYTASEGYGPGKPPWYADDYDGPDNPLDIWDDLSPSRRAHFEYVFGD